MRISLFPVVAAAALSAQTYRPQIPRTWDETALADLAVPLAHADASPTHVPADYYYRIPVRLVYKSYPVYHPDKEPSGYLAWLRQQEPQIAFNAETLKTEADWIKAGALVFVAPAVLSPPEGNRVRDPAYLRELNGPITRDGILPYVNYVVREKGRVEIGNAGCAFCHTRMLPDGSIIQGAQGNHPVARGAALSRQVSNAANLEAIVSRSPGLNGLRFLVPWLQRDPNARVRELAARELLSAWGAIPAGVIPRHAGIVYPTATPDLIGLKDRRYFDKTGFIRHRTIGDLMRYAAMVQGADDFDRFGDYVKPELPDPKTLSRYSDEQLYAMALYVYSIQPPPNPNKPDALSARGKVVFEREGCAGCHTPPLYTNNALTPVEGFKVPDEHRKKFNILPVVVGTDPGLALQTRRGTGYYKIPSLKGVWYRGPFEHNGSVATLEDWFDPNRLRDDYVPTGFKGYGVKTRAVKGHEFGLKLNADDKKALIEFLKTL